MGLIICLWAGIIISSNFKHWSKFWKTPSRTGKPNDETRILWRLYVSQGQVQRWSTQLYPLKNRRYVSVVLFWIFIKMKNHIDFNLWINKFWGDCEIMYGSDRSHSVINLLPWQVNLVWLNLSMGKSPYVCLAKFNFVFWLLRKWEELFWCCLA